MKTLTAALFLLAFSASAQEQTESVKVEMNVPGMPGAQMKMDVKVQTEKKAEPASTAAAAPARDCGTGNDSGCTMMKAGELPMDAETFHGFIDSLKGNDNELTRQDMVNSTFKANYLTAKQLGVVLDLFDNEISRLEVAKSGAPRLVDPKHALVLSKKFPNSIQAGEFNETINKQR